MGRKREVGMKMQGPVEVTIKVHITNGELVGSADISVGLARYPTEKEQRDMVLRFAEGDQMLDGFRLMTKQEWWDLVASPVSYEEEDENGNLERIRFAMPGGIDWDEKS